MLIDLLVLFTDTEVSLRGSASAVETEIANYIAITNQAHADSGSRVRFSLARAEQVEDVRGSSNNGVLHDVTDNALPGVDVPALRDQSAADLVMVLRPYVAGDFTCGIAWLQSSDQAGLNADDDLAYSVVNTDESCGRYVFPHELGHNFGSTHDRVTSTQEGVLQYGAYADSFGYRQDGPPAFATIMAYEENRPWLGYFSNPDSTACGAACGEPDKADNVRSMNRVAPAVAAFRGPPGTLAISDAEGIEGIAGETGWIRVPVRLSGVAPAGGVTFRVEIIGGTASAAGDFEDAGTKSLTIGEGKREVDFMLGIIGDDIEEGDETVVLRLSDPVNAGIGDGEATAIIADDDPRILLHGRVKFPPGTIPPDYGFWVNAFGADGGKYSQRHVTAEPPDFRYSLPVLANTPFTLMAYVPQPSVGLEEKIGPLNADTELDYQVVAGKLATIRFKAPESGPGLAEETLVFVTEVVDNEIRTAGGASMMPGDVMTRWVAPGSNLVVEATPPPPYMPYRWIDGYVSDDIDIDVVPSLLPSAYVWGFFPVVQEDHYAHPVITLSAPAPEGGVTMFYHTVSGSAKANRDYVPVSGTLAFAAGERSKSMEIDLVEDGSGDDMEYFDFEIANVRGASPTSSKTRFIVRDPQQPRLSLTGVGPRWEGAANSRRTVDVLVELSEADSESAITMFYHTVSGTARSREDYKPVSGTLTFGLGETRKWLQVEIYGDDQIEGDEYFHVEVANVVGAVPVTPRLRITLPNDDE